MKSFAIGLLATLCCLGITNETALALDSTDAVSVDDNGRSLTVWLGDRQVLRYHYAIVEPPVGASPAFRRSGFIHPLRAPDGQILTTIHPRDHFHHFGLWHPWTNTEFEGHHLDFWNLGANLATCRFVDLLSVCEGAEGGFRVRQEYVDLTPADGEKQVLDETLEVKVQAAPDQSGAFIIDYAITQRCASESSLTLNAYRYGGFGFRATEAWSGTNSFLLTSEGIERDQAHTTRARWCNVYGTSDEGPAGIVFMSHPQNHEHPEPLRVWDSKQNRGQSNMFINFCPIQQKEWILEPGQEYTLRYRLYVYSGSVAAEKAELLWKEYTEAAIR